jgi:uncharacterized protein (TIGR00369 family)
MELDLGAINRSRMYQAMGIRLTDTSTSHAVSELTATAPMCWPLPTQPHGGVLFTQMDTTMATAALGGDSVAEAATMTLNIHYLAPAASERLVCTATVERRGAHTCFVHGETVTVQGVVVCTAQGSFRTFAKRFST